MQIEYLRLDELIPYENNPRDNTQAIEKVQASIDAFDFRNPIQVDKNKVIICGHTRYYAAKRLGLEVVPVIIQADMTEEEADAYRLADNKTQEFALWDDDKLNEELDKIKNINLSDFGFEKIDAWFNRTEKEGKAREEGNEEYNEFLEKFEAKKTTDDCYTPDNIYDAIAEWVANEYGLKRSNFVRPFYPGGDYQAQKYGANDVVVDNPPFSILAEIIRFYSDNGIKFFLFAPALTLFSSSSSCTALCTYVQITYENGANVATAFVTNLEDESIRLKSTPTLYAKIKAENDKNLKAQHKDLKKHSYPLYLVTSPMVGLYSKFGIDYEVRVSESIHTRQLDAQKESGDAIYGSGYLVSEKKKAEREKAEREKAEREKAEREKAERWELSEREKEMIKSLGD